MYISNKTLFKCILNVFVFILGTISTCTTGLKVLYDPSDCTGTTQATRYNTKCQVIGIPLTKRLKDDHLSTP